MNIDLLGTDLKDDSRSAGISAAVSSGFTAAGNVLASFFGYKTAQLKQGMTDPSRTAYTPPQQSKPKKDNTTLFVVGGTAAAAILAMVALR